MTDEAEVAEASEFKRLRVYIAGPITGKKDLNKHSFAAAEVCLREAGHIPVNPHKLHDGREDLSYGEYMKTDLKALLECDAVHMLPGWGASRGAKLERDVSWLCDIPLVRINGKLRTEDPYPFVIGDGNEE